MTKSLPVLRPGMKNRFEREAEAARQAIKEVGVEVFAVHTGKSEATIRSEMVPTRSPESPHKLGFDDALAAIYLSGDITALVVFLDRLDYNVVPSEGVRGPGGREHSSLRVMAAAAIYNKWLAEALDDGRITDRQWEDGTELLKIVEREAAMAVRIN